MASRVIETNILIIGAGPAGATTSLFLTKQKIKHTIVDAAVFPRDKVCGDAIDLKVIRVLNQLDPAIVQEILNDTHFTKAWGASIIVSKDKKLDFDVDRSENALPFFLVSKRAYFDNFLVKKIDETYADFRQGTKVKKLTRVNGKWHIEALDASGDVMLIANLIVGADGDHSTVLRHLGERKIDRKHYAGALRQYWKGISDLTEQNRMEVYLPKSLPLAYLWIFPLTHGEANVGCGLVSDIMAERSIDLKKLLHELLTQDPALAYRFRHAAPLEKPVGWGLPFASKQRTVYGDGYLLTGDAAALVCPTTGEGIGPGMMSGFIAAKFIQRAVKANSFNKEMFVHYDREIYRRLQDDVKKYKLLRKLSPQLYNALLKLWAGSGVSGYFFKKSAAKWIETARKPIDVDL